MYISCKDLIEELQRYLSIHSCEIPDSLMIREIRMLPAAFDPYRDHLPENTLFVCEYWQLVRIDPHADLPPLICIVEANATPVPSMLIGRSIVIVYGSTLTDTLLALTNSAYNLGSCSPLLAEVSHSFLKCTSFPQLMSEGFRALKNPIIITDSSQKIMYYTDPDLISNPAYRAILSTNHLPIGHPTPSTSTQFWEEQQIPFVFSDANETQPFSLVCKPLYVGTVALGHLHLLTLIRPFNHKDEGILEFFGNTMALMLWQQKRNERSLFDNSKERFFRDILDCRFSDSSSILEAKKAKGLSLGKYLCAYVFNVRSLGADFNAPGRILFSDLIPLVQNSIPGSTAFLYRNSVFAVVESTKEFVTPDAIPRSLLSAMEKYGLLLGISNSFSDISELRMAGYQCRKAIQYGSAIHPDSNVYPYSSYSIYYAIERCLKDDSVRSFCPPALIKLIEQPEKNAELLSTLKTYLSCGRSKSTTAQMMFVHLNTIKYRLAQIQEITGMDLNDDNTVLELMLAFKMFEYKEKIGSYEPILFD